MRYELKWLIPTLDAGRVLQMVRLHPSFFRTEWPTRVVHSVYFDGPDYRAWRETELGISRREKLRVRWYDDPLSARLERKLRRNTVGDKIIEPLPALPLADLVRHVRRMPPGRGQRPVLYTHYRRHYFRSRDHRLRLTVDSEMRAGLYGQRVSRRLDGVVIELKFPTELAAAGRSAAAAIPISRGRHSKYARGMNALLGGS